MAAHYKDLFPIAREMKRKFVFHVGPTNSGKTHAAIGALIAAPDGVYAAPLRLLALEGYDRLSSALPDKSAMRTGEEEMGAEDATHLSCTIEMLPTNRKVSVAVIDEIQMISDSDRGGAWTRALLGVPAMEVHLVGSEEALPIVQALTALTGDSLVVLPYERKCPLFSLEAPVADVSALEPGDAVIAFSRRAVLALRARLIKAGIPVAVIYGDLCPEVRRKEAERFRTGAAQVLVATDAIGMGLNLPVRRVLFSGMEKFNGESTAPLSHRDVLQISGRAGRYGLHEAGFFGTFGQEAEAHAAFISSHTDPGAEVRPIIQAVFEPSPDQVRAFWVEEEDLFTAFAEFYAHYEDPLFREADYSWTDDLYTGDDPDFACSIIGAPVRFSRGPWDPARSHNLFEEFMDLGRVSVPQFALSRLKNAKDLTEAESYQHAATLYFWLAKRWPEALPDADAVRETRDRVARLMAEALGSQDLLSRTCSDCGRSLDHDFPHGICAQCFSSRYGGWDNAFDDEGDYDDDDLDDEGHYDPKGLDKILNEVTKRKERDTIERAKLGPLKGLVEVAQILGVRGPLFSSWVSSGTVRATTHGLLVKQGWSERDIEELRRRVPELLEAHPRTKKEMAARARPGP